MTKEKMALILVAAAAIAAGGCSSLPAVLPPASMSPITQAQRLIKLPRFKEVELHLLRVLYQAPKVPEVTVTYEVKEIYENAAPGAYQFQVVRTQKDKATGVTKKEKVSGHFYPDRDLVKVHKTVVL